MRSLVTLNLDFTGIKRLHSGLGKLTKLTALSLDGNELNPPFLAIYVKHPLLLHAVFNKATTELDLSECHMTRVPDALTRLTHLKRLSLVDNYIVDVNEALGELKELEDLDLDGNPLSPFWSRVTNPPHCWMNARNIRNIHARRIDVSGTSLVEVPNQLHRHGEFLESLNLRENHIRVCPRWWSVWTSLTTLDLGENELVSFPAEVTDLPQLTHLYLDGNHLPSITPAVSFLPHLVCLRADGNGLVEVSDALCSLAHLEELVLSDNRLQQLPKDLGRLVKLKKLDVSGNDLTSLPDSVGNLVLLESLDCRENRLTALPDTMSRLSVLKEVDITLNNIRALPLSFGHCHNVTSLRAQDNGLEEIPYAFCMHARPTELLLGKNKLPRVPLAMNVRGIKNCEFLLRALGDHFEHLATAEDMRRERLAQRERERLEGLAAAVPSSRGSDTGRLHPGHPDAPGQDRSRPE